MHINFISLAQLAEALRDNPQLLYKVFDRLDKLQAYEKLSKTKLRVERLGRIQNGNKTTVYLEVEGPREALRKLKEWYNWRSALVDSTLEVLVE